MDCNREEAIRAKEFAERKMQNNDFVAAKKIAEKAQKLFPDLENISQLLIVCEVHCSARNKISGTEMDWYGILQVPKSADELIIKKQYRKLALVLHPDKNKLPGAEAAFKMIGEANNVLSDRGKRSLYDMKCRAPVRPAVTMRAPHQANRNTYVPKHFTPVQPSSTNAPQPFWTTCPFCNVRYQYLREFVNRALRCQTCSKPFIAYDLGAQGAPSESNKAPESSKVRSQSSVFPPPHMGPQRNFSNNKAASESTAKNFSTTGFGGGFASKAQERVPKFFETVKPGERRSSKKTSRKRGRKSVVESSESSDATSSSESEEETFTAGSGSFEPLNGEQPRRSFRKRQQVTYDENLSDDDNLPRSMKRLRKGSSRNGKEESEEAFDDKKSKTPMSTSSHDEDGEVTETHLDGEAVTTDPSPKLSDLDDSDSDIDTEPAPGPELYNCPDPEFSDFDKAKEDKCFSVDQIWACYDSADGMPRFYARIRKIYPSEFRMRITWLEPNPEGPREVCWFNEGLPVACGNFVLGESEETTNRDTFSHQITFERGSRRCSYVIYPRKGEIWAMFKDWDISWSSDPENHKKEYKYEIVEVVSDSVEGGGIKVTHLDKVEGFVSVFQRTARDGLVWCSVPSAELLRFSHRIPSFQLSGNEREGVPPGSFELDTASLSSDFYPDTGANGSKPDAEAKGSSNPDAAGANGSNPDPAKKE